MGVTLSEGALEGKSLSTAQPSPSSPLTPSAPRAQLQLTCPPTSTHTHPGCVPPCPQAKETAKSLPRPGPGTHSGAPGNTGCFLRLSWGDQGVGCECSPKGLRDSESGPRRHSLAPLPLGPLQPRSRVRPHRGLLQCSPHAFTQLTSWTQAQDGRCLPLTPPIKHPPKSPTLDPQFLPLRVSPPPFLPSRTAGQGSTHQSWGLGRSARCTHVPPRCARAPGHQPRPCRLRREINNA